MNAKFIIAPVIALMAVTVFFLNQRESANDPLDHGTDKSLVTDSSVTENKVLEEPVSPKIDQPTPAGNERQSRNKAPGSRKAQSNTDLESLYRLVSHNEDYPTLASRVNAIKARRPNLNISPRAVLAALEKSESWETTQNPPARVRQKLTKEQLNDGRTFVEFDPIKVETLMPGDQMYIAIDELGTAYDMKVDEVKDFYNGNLMWRGSLLNVEGTEAEGGTVIITQSSRITSASVILREKDYTLESYGTDGWISNSAALFKVNPNRSDAVIPEDEGGTQPENQ